MSSYVNKTCFGKWVLSILIFTLPLALFGQADRGMMKKGLHEYYEGNIRKSLGYFEAAAAADEEKLKATYFQARCYLEMHDKKPKEALSMLLDLKDTEIPSIDRGYHYYMAMAYHQNEKFDEALLALKAIEGDSPRPEDEINLLKDNITLAKKYYAQPVKGMVVKNLGSDINSKDMEYSAVMMDDYRTILYTSRQPKSGESEIAEDGYTFEKIYKTTLDENDEWSTPVEITDGTKPKHHDATVQMMYDENKLVVFRNGNLFLTDYVEGKWSKGEKIKPVTSIAYQSHCFIADGGRTIYFSSDLASENGDLDLYVTYKEDDDKWTAPVPIVELNTPYDEDSPYLAEDGYFYYSSKGNKSMGGYDIFKSAYNSANRTWSKPQNLGYPTNTVGEDVFYNVSGKYAYYSSSRNDGFGSLDIYGAYLFDRIRLAGKIYDQEKKETIDNAMITMVHDGQTYQTVSNENGEYEIVIPFEKELDVKIDQGDKNIFEDKVAINIFFAGRNANYDFLVGGEEGALVQSKSGKIKFYTSNKLDNENLINSTEIPDEYLVKPEELIASADGDGAVGGVGEDLTPTEIAPKFESFHLQFGFDKAIISGQQFNNLEDVVAYLQKYANTKVTITGYTDSTGDANYNLQLSERRAKAAAKFLKKNGIDESRISVSGKGENNPLVPNTTKENRRKNRRAEVVIE
ncbi:OmpA family protein [Flammeovirgaceae bacterium SG7u.111]|nr:OmpA family protein [Flammeovirgaceae bacterium SG7u.132]WPO34401.1 OmpA family protein [Flammeovirgaceae bacterium SG7u.111]